MDSAPSFRMTITESQTKFFSKIVDAQVEFVSGAGGAASGLVLHQMGRQQPATKID